MSYNRTQWLDHVLDGEGGIVQQGTPVDAEHLNNIEEGIENAVSKDGGDTINDGVKFKNTTETKTNGGRIAADDAGTSVTSFDDLGNESGNRQELIVNTAKNSSKQTAVQLKRVKDGETETFDMLHSGNKDSIKPEDIGAAKASHGTHVPTPETASTKKFLRNDNTWQDVTPANIGAAPAGFGLGENTGRIATDPNTATAIGFYYLDGQDSANTGHIPAEYYRFLRIFWY